MSRLIDANKLMGQVKVIHRAVDTSKVNTDYDTGFHSATSQIQGLIETMATAYDIIANECKNKEAWYTCLKCGECGRVFKDGYMVDDGGTTIDEGGDE